MPLLEELDALRGRFLRLKHLPFVDLKAQIGLSDSALMAFANGRSIADWKLLRIEQWCDAREKMLAEMPLCSD